MHERIAAGFRCHSGWAILVELSGPPASPVLAGRGRVALLPDGLPVQPYHAVAEDGQPAAVIEAVERAACAAAAAILGARFAAVGVISHSRNLPASLDAILASHPRLHAAEGRLYEQAIIDAASDLRLPVHVLRPDEVEVTPAIEALGREAGPPWQKDHKWAAAAALAAMNR